jgi:hypothetical protein
VLVRRDPAHPGGTRVPVATQTVDALEQTLGRLVRGSAGEGLVAVPAVLGAAEDAALRRTMGLRDGAAHRQIDRVVRPSLPRLEDAAAAPQEARCAVDRPGAGIERQDGPGAGTAPPARLCCRIVERDLEGLHQAALATGVGDQLLVLPAAGGHHPFDPAARVRVALGRPEVAAAGALDHPVVGQDHQCALQPPLRDVDAAEQLVLRQALVGAVELGEQRVRRGFGGVGGDDEPVVDIRILVALEHHPVRLGHSASGATDLLVVADRPGRRLVVDDPGQVRLVVAHPERSRCHHRLHVVACEPLLDGAAVRVLHRAGVRGGIDAPRHQPVGHPLRVMGGQHVHDAGTGLRLDEPLQPRQPPRLAHRRQHVEMEAGADQVAPDREQIGTQLFGDVLDGALCRRRRGTQDAEELNVSAVSPSRLAASIWLRMSTSSGDSTSTGPRPCWRSRSQAMK